MSNRFLVALSKILKMRSKPTTQEENHLLKAVTMHKANLLSTILRILLDL